MPRFFAAGSDSETDSSSTDSEIEARPIVATKTFDWSDDEEDTKRVVKSAKEKRYEALNSIVKTIKNHKKIKDMAKILTDFEDLCKAYDKSKKVVDAEGIPRFYTRCLAELEDFINECWVDREWRKTLSKNNSKGLMGVRQKLRKYVREHQFETELKNYRENPDDDDIKKSDVESGTDSDSDDEVNFKSSRAQPGDVKSATFLKSTADDSDSDSIDWGMSSDDESSSDDEKYGENMAAKFLKKTTEEKQREKDKEKEKLQDERRAKLKKREKKRKAEDDDSDEGWEKVTGGGIAVSTTERMKLFSKDSDINPETVCKKINDVFSARGKKGTNRSELISLLIELRSIATQHNLGTAMDIKILLHIISSIFDYNPNISSCMKESLWEKCMQYIEEMIQKLSENPHIVVNDNVPEESESFDGDTLRVRGCALTKVERLDEEYTKLLQNCDAHSTEYVDRLKDEIRVCNIITLLQAYLEETKATTEEICRIYIKRIEHIYYKFDPLSKSTGNTGDDKNAESQRCLLNRLCKFIYARDNTDRIRTRAILCQIYHDALHDFWFDARNMMLMSHLQETIQHSDVPTQILYNRAMAQLGLCAFRQGLIKEAHSCLVDIQSVGRAKELLAQGLLLQRQYERTAEQEKIEKRRQMPYHMHINLELLECTYLVSAMLIEIPFMAAHEFDARRRMISKNFHHVLRVIDRQPLVGPPESMREHVVAASKAMKQGNWNGCKNFLINEKMNAKVWSLFRDSEKIKRMISTKIQEESLHTYLFTYSGIYDTLSLQKLSEMFELGLSTVHSSVSKMIHNEDLMASLDEPTQSIVMHRTEPSPLQSLSLQLSEKISTLVDNNERLLETKSSGGFYFQKQGSGGYQNQQQRDARNRQAERSGDGSGHHSRGGSSVRRGIESSRRGGGYITSSRSGRGVGYGGRVARNYNEYQGRNMNSY